MKIVDAIIEAAERILSEDGPDRLTTAAPELLEDPAFRDELTHLALSYVRAEGGPPS